MREVREEAGVVATIRAPIDAWFEGDTTETMYFLMDLVEDLGTFDAETARVRWVDLDEAEALLRETKSARGRARDLRLLEIVRRTLSR